METLANHLESLQFTIAICTIPVVCLLGLIFAAIHRVADELSRQTLALRSLSRLLAHRDLDLETSRELARRDS